MSVLTYVTLGIEHKMARLYIAGHLVTHWTVVLAIVYGILALITLVMATILAYHGKTPYKQIP